MSAHLKSTGLTYLGHLRRAWSLGFRMAKGSAVLIIHGLVPDWFEHTGSDIARELYLEIIEEEIKRDTVIIRGTDKTNRSSAPEETLAPY